MTQATQALIDMPPPPTDEPPAASGSGGGGLVRVTCNLTPRAFADLQKLSEEIGLSRTDVVNRAVQVYALVEQLMKEAGGGHLTVVGSDGKTEKIYIV